MTALPGNLTKTNLDQGTDDPKAARSDIAGNVDKSNSIIAYLSGLFGAGGTSAEVKSKLGYLTDQSDVEGALTGEISSHTHPVVVTGPVLHDLTSSFDVSLPIAAGYTPADFIASGLVVATKAAVPLKPTDRLIVDVENMQLDNTAGSNSTTPNVWLRINGFDSTTGPAKDGVDQFPLGGSGGLYNYTSATAGTVLTYTKSHHAGTFAVLASDFITVAANYTVDVMISGGASSTQAGVVKGATSPTIFNLRVEA